MSGRKQADWEFAIVAITAEERAALLAMLDQARAAEERGDTDRRHGRVASWWTEGRAFLRDDWPDGAITLHIDRSNLRVLPEVLAEGMRHQLLDDQDPALRSLQIKLESHRTHQQDIDYNATSRARRRPPTTIEMISAGPSPLSSPREHAVWVVPVGFPTGEDAVRVYADAVDGVTLAGHRDVLRELAPEHAEELAGALASAARTARAMREHAAVLSREEAARLLDEERWGVH